jgi:RNA polymerase sigma-70 factor (family 1)
LDTSITYEEKALFRRIAVGDEAAFTDIFRRYTAKLLPFVLKLTRGDDQQAKEIIQETLLRLWANRTELTKVDQPSSWIFRIASNVSVNYLRALGKRRLALHEVQMANNSIAENNEKELEAKELEGFIHRAVAALPEKRQQIYRLSREQGLTHQQIADNLGLSINTVREQIGKALKTIHEHIQQSTGLSLITVILLLSL